MTPVVPSPRLRLQTQPHLPAFPCPCVRWFFIVVRTLSRTPTLLPDFQVHDTKLTTGPASDGEVWTELIQHRPGWRRTREAKGLQCGSVSSRLQRRAAGTHSKRGRPPSASVILVLSFSFCDNSQDLPFTPEVHHTASSPGVIASVSLQDLPSSQNPDPPTSMCPALPRPGPAPPRPGPALCSLLLWV